MKGKKTNSIKFIKKYWLVMLTAILSVFLVCFVAFGAYTNLNSVKRVVSTKGGKELAFSSNYLKAVENTNTTNYSTKIISVPSTVQDNYSFGITVCNYPQDNPFDVNENDITYTLTLTLVDASGETQSNYSYDITVSYNETTSKFASGVCTIGSQMLKGKTKSINTYTVTVPKTIVESGINIKAEAVPDDTSKSYTDNKNLARIFTFSEYTPNTTNWTGSFAETETDGYDGFNYIVQGQGKGTVTIEWNSEQLEISQIFLKNNNITAITGTESDWEKITFNVNSDTQNRYDIQFYKTSGGDYKNIDTLNGYVTLTFKESTT